MEARKRSSTLEESAIIERVARIGSSMRGTKPDYTYLAAELEQAIPFDIFGVVLLRHDRQAARVTVCQREAEGWVALYHQHPLQGSKLQQMLETSSLVVQEYPAGLDGLPTTVGDALSGYHQLRCTLIAPLAVDGRVLGTLELGSVDRNIYADQTLQRLICAVAGVLATAIESAQVGGNVQIQDRQRQALKVVSSSLAEKIDLPTILDQIVSGISQALNVASAIFMLDHVGEKISLQAQCGLHMDALSTSAKRELLLSERSIIGQTLRRHIPYVSQNIITDERFPDSRACFSTLGMHSIFSYPLVAGTKIYGALVLCSPETGGFTPLKADILSLFASQATVAIHNGILLESAQHRRRFQKAIEQLDQACESHASQALGVEGEQALGCGASQQEDVALLEQVRREAQQTFGVSFTSLLRFICDHLLTQNERDLQSLVSTDHSDQIFDALSVSPSESATLSRGIEPAQPHADTLALLTRTAEAALVRAGTLGEIGRLLMQLKQSTQWVNDAWFVVDLNGLCSYMNAAALSFCDVHIEEMAVPYDIQLLSPLSELSRREHSLFLAQLFEKLLPRIRNVEEVNGYLHSFMQEGNYQHELRCVLAMEPVVKHPSLSHIQSDYTSQMPIDVPSDYYYRFIRYPLYNQQNHLEAIALQVRDVTQQVRNERNMSALLSSVSHDLRTPLTTIKAAATGLLQTDARWSKQDCRAMLEDIDSETDHLTVSVNALIELSRIEMGALILEKEWCDVLEVGYGALRKLKPILAGRDVDVQACCQLPLVYADHVQLERVFSYLIENAVRHSPEHGKIQILLDVVKNGAMMLRVQLIDQGAGLPEQERKGFFQSLQRVRSYGHGLGLAICKGIIDAHQGHIWLEAAPQEMAVSPECEGACFLFTLPLHPYSIISNPLKKRLFGDTPTPVRGDP